MCHAIMMRHKGGLLLKGGCVRRCPCHVVYTDYRPTPLQHFMFPSGGDGLFLIVDERSTFREDNFQKAIAALTSSAADAGAQPTLPILAGAGCCGQSLIQVLVICDIAERQAGRVLAGSTLGRLCCSGHALLLAAGSNKGKKGSLNGKKAEESDIFKLVRMIMQRKFDPVPPCLLFITSFGMM